MDTESVAGNISYHLHDLHLERYSLTCELFVKDDSQFTLPKNREILYHTVFGTGFCLFGKIKDKFNAACNSFM